MAFAKLEKNIGQGERYVHKGNGKLKLVGSIGKGATFDCRGCELEIEGDRADNVIIHSIGKPKITGEKGENVTYYIYDKLGNCIQQESMVCEEDMVFGAGTSHQIFIGTDGTNSLVSFHDSVAASRVTSTKDDHNEKTKEDGKSADSAKKTEFKKDEPKVSFKLPSLVKDNVQVTAVGRGVSVGAGAVFQSSMRLFGVTHQHIQRGPAPGAEETPGYR